MVWVSSFGTAPAGSTECQLAGARDASGVHPDETGTVFSFGRFWGALQMEVAAVAYSVAFSPFYGHFMFISCHVCIRYFFDGSLMNIDDP